MTNKTDEKLVSLCMITKNEEKVLDRCLSSINEYVDEIIIIDTGSTDSTKQIAKKYTDLVFDFEWINDFSAARNEGVKRATGTWILILDADEYFAEHEGQKLRDFLSTQTPAHNRVYSLSIINFLGDSSSGGSILESNADRIFPNGYNIQFYRAIHEQLYSQTKDVTLHSIRTPVAIYHTGYTEEAKAEKDKLNRNKEIFMNFKGKSLSDYDCFTLGNELSADNDLERAHYYYHRAFKKRNAQTAWYPFCLISLLNVTLQLDRLKDAWDLIENDLVKYQGFPEYDTIIGTIYRHLGFNDIAEQHFLKSIELSEKRAQSGANFWLISPDYGAKKPFEELSNIYYQRRDIKNTIYFLTKTLINDNKSIKYLLLLIQLLSQNDETSDVIQLLDQLFPDASPLQQAMLFKLSLNLGQLALSEHYYELISEQNITVSTEDQLRLFIIRQDQSSFEQELEQLTFDNIPSDGIIKHMIIASLAWHQPSYMNKLQLPEDHDLYQLTQVVHRYLHDQTVEQSVLDDCIHNISHILTQLFTLQLYDQYEQLLAYLDEPRVINDLANFFYRNNLMETAINYYTVMLEQYPEHLDGEAYENLAFLHFNNDIIDDAVAFFEKAVEKKPHFIHYTYICRYTKDAELKERYKQEIIEHFPHYQRLPMIQSL